MSNVNETEVSTFLSFLDPENNFTFTVLDTNTKKVFLGCRAGSGEEMIKLMAGMNGSAPGATLHVTLNRTKAPGTKRRTADIESARVLCVDLDREVSREEIKELVTQYKIQMIVESSPGKYHLYWKIDPTTSLEVWSNWQLALAWIFKADTNLSQVTKTIRVPGVKRITKDGKEFWPSIVWLVENPQPLKFIEVQDVFPQLGEALKAAQESRKESNKALRVAVAAGGPIDISAGRNDTVYSVLRAHAAELTFDMDGQPCTELSYEEAWSTATKLNNEFPEPLSEQELESVVKSALEHGLAVRQEKLGRLKDAVAAFGTQEPATVVIETAQVVKNALVSVSGIPSSPATVQAPQPFKDYDYSAGELKLNRFTDAAVVERVFQKYPAHIVRVGSLLYVFDPAESVWRRGGKELVWDMSAACCVDTIKDPAFMPTLCTSSDGSLSQTKKKSWEAHYRSSRVISSVCQGVMTSGERIARKELTDFDAQPYLLNCASGVVDMLSGRVFKAGAADYLLHYTPVEFDPRAPVCAGWLRFLGEIFAYNENPASMAGFIQELFGYSLSGSMEAQKVFIHFGSGCNGKSKLLECLAYLTGDYHTRLSCNTFSKSKNALVSEFNRLGAKLEGKRCAILDDLDSATQWNEGFVKNMTGPVLLSRRLYEEERDIPNRCKVHFGCNEAPKPESENYGILRRLCIIPYLSKFEPNMDKERELGHMVRQEASGILSWAVEGLRRVVGQGGFSYPSEVLGEVEEYREDNFTIETLLFDLMEPASEFADSWYSASTLVELVNRKLEASGQSSKKISPDLLGRTLRSSLRVACKRVTCSGKKERFYSVKLKCELEDSLVEKLDHLTT
jgi:P4 family phage/plasmid primase-like protien